MLQNPISHHDVVVVGAGPAGLSAARTAARLGFDTLVIERQSGPGELSHPCFATMTPAPGLAAGEAVPRGLHFPQIDLLLPASLVVARDGAFRCLAPGGHPFPLSVDSEDQLPVMVDKPGLLRLLARQAQAAGAEFRWGTDASSLVYDGGRVAGVRTPAGDITAEIVIMASGGGDHLCQSMRDTGTGGERGHLLVLSQDLDAPLVGPTQLGCMITLGRPYTSAPAGFGALVTTAPGRATMIFTLQVQELDCSLVDRAWQFLAEYAHDPRISGLLGGACVLRRSSFLLPRGTGAGRVVQDGLILAGDAAAPAGQLGILPAMHLGRQAALTAAGALDSDDTSAEALAPYDEFWQTLILPNLQAETRALDALLSMDDAELDRLCGLLNWLHLPLPVFFGRSRVPGETVGWLAAQMDLSASDRRLLARVFAPAAISEGAVAWPTFADSSAALA